MNKILLVRVDCLFIGWKRKIHAFFRLTIRATHESKISHRLFKRVIRHLDSSINFGRILPRIWKKNVIYQKNPLEIGTRKHKSRAFCFQFLTRAKRRKSFSSARNFWKKSVFFFFSVRWIGSINQPVPPPPARFLITIKFSNLNERKVRYSRLMLRILQSRVADLRLAT